MNEEIQDYILKYSDKVQMMFNELRSIVINNAPNDVDEKMWSKLPSYYIGKRFVRIIPFKDHINIEASNLFECRSKLSGYKFTPKGMLQIFIDQDIPSDILKEFIW